MELNSYVESNRRMVVLGARWYRSLLFLFVVSLPFTHALSVNPWLPLPLVVMGLFFATIILEMISSGRAVKLSVNAIDWFLVSFLVSMLLSSVVNIADLESVRLNHLFSYFVVTVFYYWGSRVLLAYSQANTAVVLRYLKISVAIASLYALIEVLGKTLLGFDIDAFLPREDSKEMMATYLDIFRARSFTSEPGSFALFLEIFGPLTLYYHFKHVGIIKGLPFALLVFAAFVLTFSTAAFVILPLSCCVALLVYGISLIIRGKISLRFVVQLGLFVIGGGALFIYSGAALLAPIVTKLSFSGDASSSSRVDRWGASFDQFLQQPFLGGGAGNFLDLGAVGQGVVSWWLQVLVESGVFGALFLSLFFLAVISVVLRIQGPIKYPFLIAVVSTSIHYLVISDYWLPWVWFLVAMIQFARVEGRADFATAGCAR